MEQPLAMAGHPVTAGLVQQLLIESGGDFVTAGVNMRPHGDDQIGQCHPLLAKTGQTVVDNTADQPLPAGMHAADVATVARAISSGRQSAVTTPTFCPATAVNTASACGRVGSGC